jgi:hypothetical protein
MAGYPNVPQGLLNRALASVFWPSFPTLTVTAPFLGREGVSLGFEGNATTFIGTMTGNVVSQEPYQMVMLTINLLKSQPLAQLYESKRQSSSLLGNGTVRPDSPTLGPFGLINCGIEDVRELRFSGEDAGYVVTIRGTYPVNNSMFT